MPTTNTVLTAGMLMLIATVTLWDLWVMRAGSVDATLSDTIRGLAARNPVLPLLAGILLGHLFWCQKP